MIPAPRLLAACLAAAAFAAAPSAASAPPRYVFHDVAFVTVIGHGSVRTEPRGISCPSVCRALFLRGAHVRFLAHAAAGWRFVGFRSEWCGGGTRSRCAFDLVSQHECVGGNCPVGAYGVRAIFGRAGS